VRDVIHVERQPASGGTADTRAPTTDGTWVGPAIDGDSLAALGRVADEVLPPLVARLAVSTLGELEVRHRDWHVRVRRAAHDGQVPSSQVGTAPGLAVTDHPTPAGASASTHSPDIATSPAVGYFAPRPELAVGARVALGDVLGWVEVLGVRQEVVAPVDGLVGKLLVGPGDPVEYGEELVQLVPGAAKAERADQDGADA
jgi:methylmalonyl-CoA carboxyltransferase small subunit